MDRPVCIWAAIDVSDLGNDLNLAECTRRQCLCGDTGAGRFSRKVAGIDFVECSKVAHVCKEAGCLDYMCEIGTRSSEDSGEVLADLLCLLADRCACDLAGDGIDADLTRCVDEIADPHRLTIGTEGGGGVLPFIL